MEQLLIYLLKSSALLTIFLIAYQLLLRNDTSFQVNRGFLLAGLLTSLLLPTFEITRVVQVAAQALPANFDTSVITNDISSTPQPTDWWLIGGIIYFLGMAFFLFRIFIQLFSLLNILRKGLRTKKGQNILIHSEKMLTPFSFFRYIVFNPALHSEAELKIVLQHEKVHASQWHSADVLFSNLAAAVLWFNPLSLWYKNSLVQNLEFIADKETVAAAVAKKDYQHTLVKISVADYQPALANNFYQSLIKKRIIMLNKKPSRNLSLIKVSAVIPFICAFMFFFNVRTQAQVATTVTISNSSETNQNSPTGDFLSKVGEAPLYIINDKQYKTRELTGKSIQLKGIFIVLSKEEAGKKYGNSAKDGAIIISKGEIIDDFKAYLKDIDDTDLPVRNRYIQVLEDAKPIFLELEKTTDTETFSGPPVKVNHSLTRLGNGIKVVQTDSIQPLYILDGEILSADFDINSIKPDDIATINVLKGDDATEAYGEKAKNGVIMINLKEGREKKETSNLTLVINEKDPNEDILFVLNGKVMDTSFEAHKVEAENIESINVLKGKSAIDKYGEKAKDGVIEIITKDKE